MKKSIAGFALLTIVLAFFNACNDDPNLVISTPNKSGPNVLISEAKLYFEQVVLPKEITLRRIAEKIKAT